MNKTRDSKATNTRPRDEGTWVRKETCPGVSLRYGILITHHIIPKLSGKCWYPMIWPVLAEDTGIPFESFYLSQSPPIHSHGGSFAHALSHRNLYPQLALAFQRDTEQSSGEGKGWTPRIVMVRTSSSAETGWIAYENEIC